MKNFLTEKLMINSMHGRNCTLEVCKAGEPDNDDVVFRGDVLDCLAKTQTNELEFDCYFSLYTKKDNYCGYNFEELCYRMGMTPEYVQDILDSRPSLDIQISHAEQQSTDNSGISNEKIAEPER